MFWLAWQLAGVLIAVVGIVVAGIAVFMIAIFMNVIWEMLGHAVSSMLKFWRPLLIMIVCLVGFVAVLELFGRWLRGF